MLFVKLKGASAAVNVMPLYAPAPTLKSPASDTLENASASNLGTRFVHGGKVTCPAARNCGGGTQAKLFTKICAFVPRNRPNLLIFNVVRGSKSTPPRPPRNPPLPF